MRDLLIAGCVEAVGSLFWVTVFADLSLKVVLKVWPPPQPSASYRRALRGASRFFGRVPQHTDVLKEAFRWFRCCTSGSLLQLAAQRPSLSKIILLSR